MVNAVVLKVRLATGMKRLTAVVRKIDSMPLAIYELEQWLGRDSRHGVA